MFPENRLCFAPFCTRSVRRSVGRSTGRLAGVRAYITRCDVPPGRGRVRDALYFTTNERGISYPRVFVMQRARLFIGRLAFIRAFCPPLFPRAVSPSALLSPSLLIRAALIKREINRIRFQVDNNSFRVRSPSTFSMCVKTRSFTLSLVFLLFFCSLIARFSSPSG